MEWPTLGWLIGVLVALAVPVVVILVVIGVISLEQARARRSASPDDWSEEPDGRRYPTGREEPGESGGASSGETGEDPGEPGGPSPGAGPPDRPRS
ncbi:hypothetical protein KIK06_04040 [Nocardiopsis sp. EMB25]|uniref:hypothetical protein n=1 Tax=Nocardiopsis sp. EMB25 TaxID=2835867 RepID=UPI002283983B|nr:hypothetical protein [Nocardiopsis sp. EMB25]MCY9783059.1 hypothetical protein [Nocardiopsis sp. EMB25]